MFGRHSPDDTEAKYKQARLIAAYKALFMSDSGKAILDDLSSYGCMDKSTFDPDPYISANYAGRRDVVLHIFEFLNTNITDYLTEHAVKEDFDYD